MVDLERTKKVAGRFFRKVGDDIGAAVDRAGDAVDKKFDQWHKDADALVDSPIFKEYMTTAKSYAVKGKDEVRKGLEALATKYNAQLNEMVGERPALAGAIDGVYNVFTDNDPKRSKSTHYNRGYGVGKAVGWSASAYLFVAGGAVAMVAGAVPVAQRIGPKVSAYLKETLDTARTDVDGKPGEKK